MALKSSIVNLAYKIVKKYENDIEWNYLLKGHICCHNLAAPVW